MLQFLLQYILRLVASAVQVVGTSNK